MDQILSELSIFLSTAERQSDSANQAYSSTVKIVLSYEHIFLCCGDEPDITNTFDVNTTKTKLCYFNQTLCVTMTTHIAIGTIPFCEYDFHGLRKNDNSYCQGYNPILLT